MTYSDTLTTCPRCGTYTSAPTHCGQPVGRVAVCACGCPARNHGYRRLSGRNDGACLGHECRCVAYEECP